MGFPIDVLLVPQGREYEAVRQGLGQVKTPQVLPIPIGGRSVTHYLQTALKTGQIPINSQVLLMGLCGGLTPECKVGQIVLYRQCLNLNHAQTLESQACDFQLTQQLLNQLQDTAIQVTGLTSDRIIHTAAEKRDLALHYPVAVVDMEGFAALQVLSQAGIAVTMLRVVSDGCEGDVPDLQGAIAADGALRPLPLFWRMVQQPIAALRLIRGSLTGLRVLQSITANLFADTDSV